MNGHKTSRQTNTQKAQAHAQITHTQTHTQCAQIIIKIVA